MNDDNNRLKLPVILTLTDGRELTVDMIVNLGGAMDRTMNNEASYILIGEADGSERLLAKNAILEVADAKKARPKAAAMPAAAINTATQETGTERQVQAPSMVPQLPNPHQVLGIDPTASLDDIRNTFTHLAQIYNPDRIAAMGLPQDVIEFCQTRYHQISEAYAKLTEGHTPTLAAPAPAA